ncbi:MAG: UTP--glucose-1-phosphate uridylyltransferase GalU [Acidobacteria bacterium]|nr:UTP--glucose-1-phosphate uridylyltransferase GalU [Acidobacteriota bacterium]
MPKRVRKAVFPAAGLGTRFLPATKAQPKEMLPLVDKPIIQYAVEEALESGIETIIIVTGRGKNAIEDHFDVSFELEKNLEARGKHDLLKQVRSISDLMQICYVRQKEALGLGHAILMARDLVGDEPFAVLLGDDVIDAPTPCLRQLIDVHTETNASVIAIQQIASEKISSYGVISAAPLPHASGPDRLFKINDLVEKPPAAQAPSNLAIIGRYILEPQIFEALATTPAGAGGEIQLTDALRTLLRSHPIYGYRFEGTRYDTGDKLGFLTATVEFALRRPDLGPAFREYLKSLRLT